MPAEEGTEGNDGKREKWLVGESRENHVMNKERRKRGLPTMTMDDMVKALKRGEKVMPEGTGAAVAKKRRGEGDEVASQGGAAAPSGG